MGQRFDLDWFSTPFSLHFKAPNGVEDQPFANVFGHAAAGKFLVFIDRTQGDSVHLTRSSTNDEYIPQSAAEASSSSGLAWAAPTRRKLLLVGSSFNSTGSYSLDSRPLRRQTALQFDQSAFTRPP